MTETILFVDDDILVVSAIQRSLRKSYRMEMALTAGDALAALQESPYAVVVSDFQMPGMNGVELLKQVKDLSPETVRVLLTGQADLETAIDAVNDGNIFRFLRKPCPQGLLLMTLEASLAQYRLQIAERDVLQETLLGTVAALTEMLSAIEPAAFGRASRLRWCVRKLALELRMKDPWQFEAAALLSQIGCISLHPEALRKHFVEDETALGDTRRAPSPARVARQLLERIPRLHTVAQIIDRQQDVFERRSEHSPEEHAIGLGAGMLHVAIDFDQRVSSGLSFRDALADMRRRDSEYAPEALTALGKLVQDAGQADTATGPSSLALIGRPLHDSVSQRALP